MIFSKENVIDLSHKMIMGKENFRFQTEYLPVEESHPTAGYVERAEDVWYIESFINMSSHAGTHIEFPFHHRKDGMDPSVFPLDRLTGECTVIDARGKKPKEGITLEEVKKYEKTLKKDDIIFFWTGYDKFYRTIDWELYPHVEPDALLWLMDQYNPKIIGTDGSSIEILGTNHQPNHTEAFARDIPFIESLTNLGEIAGERTTVFVFATPMAGVDSVPVRVVAIKGL